VGEKHADPAVELAGDAGGVSPSKKSPSSYDSNMGGGVGERGRPVMGKTLWHANQEKELVIEDLIPLEYSKFQGNR
jgi:hypothetical protein